MDLYNLDLEKGGDRTGLDGEREKKEGKREREREQPLKVRSGGEARWQRIQCRSTKRVGGKGHGKKFY